jgi:hypothetical protein
MNNQSTSPALDAVQRQSAAYAQKAHLLAGDISAIYVSHRTFLEAVSVFISAILIGATIYFIIKTGWLALRINRVQDVLLKTNIPKREAKKTWAAIQEHFFTGGDNDLKIAILEADKVLDEALRGAGIQGNTLGDRLKKLKPSQLPDIDAIWQAHKLRNQIAHENDFKLKRDLAERALGVYEKALRELKVLD